MPFVYCFFARKSHGVTIARHFGLQNALCSGYIPRAMAGYWGMAGGGVELAIAILLGLFGGQWLDRRLGTGPWLLILGVFLGAAAGFYNLYRALTAGERRRSSPAAEDQRGPDAQ